jgi:hypothetical protein
MRVLEFLSFHMFGISTVGPFKPAVGLSGLAVLAKEQPRGAPFLAFLCEKWELRKYIGRNTKGRLSAAF